MKDWSFRLEFLIPGLVTLCAAAYLADSLAAVDWAALLPTMEGNAAVNTLAAVGIVGGASYILGIVVVMGSFALVVQPMIHAVREQRLGHLVRTFNTAVAASPPAGSAPLGTQIFASLPANWVTRQGRGFKPAWVSALGAARCKNCNLTTHKEDVELLVSIGMAAACDAVVAEYAYRRYVRQLAAGVLLALPLLAAALGAAIAKSDHSNLNAWVLWIAVAAPALLLGHGLLMTIHYQELRAQGFLLDAALQASLP